MDSVALTYYATICALLGALSPTIPNILARLIIGAAVGVGAATALPSVRLALGL